jgi:predicted RNase H-like HicB family nuclease
MAPYQDQGESQAVQAYDETGNSYGGREAQFGRPPWNSKQHSEASWIERTEINMKYLVVLEKSANSFGAYVPDLPGCAVVGETKEEALRLIREAITLHVESLREAGDSVPEPASTTEYVQV